MEEAQQSQKPPDRLFRSDAIPSLSPSPGKNRHPASRRPGRAPRVGHRHPFHPKRRLPRPSAARGPAAGWGLISFHRFLFALFLFFYFFFILFNFVLNWGWWKGSKNSGGTQGQAVTLRLRIPSRMLAGWIRSLPPSFGSGTSSPTRTPHRTLNPTQWHKPTLFCNPAVAINVILRIFPAISTNFSTSQAQLAVVPFRPQICYEF